MRVDDPGNDEEPFGVDDLISVGHGSRLAHGDDLPVPDSDVLHPAAVPAHDHPSPDNRISLSHDFSPFKN